MWLFWKGEEKKPSVILIPTTAVTEAKNGQSMVVVYN
jgi:hypothetical protein